MIDCMPLYLTNASKEIQQNGPVVNIAAIISIGRKVNEPDLQQDISRYNYLLDLSKALTSLTFIAPYL